MILFRTAVTKLIKSCLQSAAFRGRRSFFPRHLRRILFGTCIRECSVRSFKKSAYCKWNRTFLMTGESVNRRISRDEIELETTRVNYLEINHYIRVQILGEDNLVMPSETCVC